ncbi:glycosyltransferase [Shewanella scandinavica]|uniref:glycosyltransferase n=1 Tax=Shewanella scandinavica TaxID=3063538 RepID=UPI0031906203
MTQSNKKRIVFTISKPVVGGAQFWVSNLCRLLKDEFDVHIITSCEGWLTDNSHGATIHVIKSLDTVSLICFRNLFRCLRVISPDVIVSSSAFAGFYSRLMHFLIPCRNVYVSHGWSALYKTGFFSKLFVLVEKLLVYATDYVLCVSNEDAEKAINNIGYGEHKVKVISNKVFIDTPSHKLNLPNGFNVLFVGRLEPPKRPDLFISSLKSHLSIHGFIIGDGSLKSKLTTTNNITFLGEISSFNNFVEFDLFVLASDSEGLPMSAIQAASVGVPLLLSDVGGCSELIDENLPNGLLTKNTIEDFTNNLTTILNDYSFFKSNAIVSKEKHNIVTDKLLYINLFFG